MHGISSHIGLRQWGGGPVGLKAVELLATISWRSGSGCGGCWRSGLRLFYVKLRGPAVAGTTSTQRPRTGGRIHASARHVGFRFHHDLTGPVPEWWPRPNPAAVTAHQPERGRPDGATHHVCHHGRQDKHIDQAGRLYQNAAVAAWTQLGSRYISGQAISPAKLPPSCGSIKLPRPRGT